MELKNRDGSVSVLIETIPPICKPDGTPLAGWEGHFEDIDGGLLQLTWWRGFAGRTTAGHYHDGADPSKNPEILTTYLGTFELIVQFEDGSVRGALVDATFDIIKITIPAKVAHWLHWKRDGMIEECRRTTFNPRFPDTVPAGPSPSIDSTEKAAVLITR